MISYKNFVLNVMQIRRLKSFRKYPLPSFLGFGSHVFFIPPNYLVSKNMQGSGFLTTHLGQFFSSSSVGHTSKTQFRCYLPLEVIAEFPNRSNAPSTPTQSLSHLIVIIYFHDFL